MAAKASSKVLSKNTTMAQAVKNASSGPLHAIAPNSAMESSIPGTATSKKAARAAKKAAKKDIVQTDGVNNDSGKKAVAKKGVAKKVVDEENSKKDASEKNTTETDTTTTDVGHKRKDSGHTEQSIDVNAIDTTTSSTHTEVITEALDAVCKQSVNPMGAAHDISNAKDKDDDNIVPDPNSLDVGEPSAVDAPTSKSMTNSPEQRSETIINETGSDTVIHSSNAKPACGFPFGAVSNTTAGTAYQTAESIKIPVSTSEYVCKTEDVFMVESAGEPITAHRQFMSVSYNLGSKGVFVYRFGKEADAAAAISVAALIDQACYEHDRGINSAHTCPVGIASPQKGQDEDEQATTENRAELLAQTASLLVSSSQDNVLSDDNARDTQFLGPPVRDQSTCQEKLSTKSTVSRPEGQTMEMFVRAKLNASLATNRGVDSLVHCIPHENHFQKQKPHPGTATTVSKPCPIASSMPGNNAPPREPSSQHRHCTYCKRQGHHISRCFKLHPELQGPVRSNSWNARRNKKSRFERSPPAYDPKPSSENSVSKTLNENQPREKAAKDAFAAKAAATGPSSMKGLGASRYACGQGTSDGHILPAPPGPRTPGTASSSQLPVNQKKSKPENKSRGHRSRGGRGIRNGDIGNGHPHIVDLV